MSNVLKLAKELDFSTAGEYYEYIWNSKVNGNHKQARALYNALLPYEKYTCIRYLRGMLVDEHYYDFLEFLAEE